MPNRILSSRLAAKAGTRQVEVSVRADAAASAVNRAVAVVCDRVLGMLRHLDKNRTHSYQAVYAQAHATLSDLMPAIQATIAKRFTDLAHWGYASTVRNLKSTLPVGYMRAGVALKQIAESHVLERENPSGGSLLDLFLSQRGELQVNIPEPLGGDGADLAGLLFPPLSEHAAHSILNTVLGTQTWYQALDANARKANFGPDHLAKVIAQGYSLGQSQTEIARNVLPFVNDVRYRAARTARTFGLAVANESQMRAHAQLGDLVMGYQVHATLDQTTRPEHRHRDGTIYYVNPKPGQLGLKDMPDPPREADGSIAWNCRCTLSPVLCAPSWVQSDPKRLAVFTNASEKLIPDPSVYSDWFHRADERRRRIAVGTRRYSVVKNRLTQGNPRYEDFIDPHTGQLLSPDDLKRETSIQRAERLAKVRTVVHERRQLVQQVSTYGFLPDNPKPPAPFPPQPSPQPPTRQPVQHEEHRTFKAAAQFAQQKLGVKLGAGRNVKVANAVTKSLTHMHNSGQRLPAQVDIIAQPFKVHGRRAKVIPAHFDPALPDRVQVNPGAMYWQNAGKESQRNHAQGWWSAGGEHQVIQHEMGHLLHWQSIDRKRWSIMYHAKPSVQEKAILFGTVSGYACTSQLEAVAEIYAGVQSGKSYPPAVMDLYRQWGGPAT